MSNKELNECLFINQKGSTKYSRIEGYECSNCGTFYSWLPLSGIKPSYCPNCGAKIKNAHELVIEF